MMSEDINADSKPCILWSCVARDDIILAEAATQLDDDDDIVPLGKRLMKKSPTPGWEFASPWARTNKLRGVKFHVYDKTSDGSLHVWIYAAIYDSSLLPVQQVQSFIEKIVGISEMFRETDADWSYGATLAAQETFAPILLQRMEEVTYLGKLAMVNKDLDQLKSVMARNIELVLSRGDRIEDMQKEASNLKEMAGVFKERTKDIRRKMMWQNAKHGILLGTAITAGVAIVVVPPLVML